MLSLLMMSRMLLSSSCVLLFLLCLSHECNGGHLRTVDDQAMEDDKAKLLSRNSTIKGFGNDRFAVHDDLNLERAVKGRNKQTDCGLKNKKDKTKGQKVKKSKELVLHGRQHHHHHHPKSLTFQVPHPKNKRVHQQPGFNLDYSPPKTHPPSHN